MNYYEARQVDPALDRPDAGRWRYTCMNDGRIWPVGYCAEGCEGHDTPLGAQLHQREYEVDQALARGPGQVEPWAPCEAPAGQDPETGQEVPCGRRTPWAYHVGPGVSRLVHMCEAHQTREALMATVAPPGRVVSS